LSQWIAVELSIIIYEYRDEAAPYLIDALLSASPSVKLFSIEMLSKIGFIDAVVPLLELCMKNPDPIFYSAAISALGRLGDERALSMVVNASQNANKNVRLSAIEALGCLGAKNGIPILFDRMNKGGIDEKRIAAKALGKLGEDGSNVLFEMLNSIDKPSKLIALETIEELERNRE